MGNIWHILPQNDAFKHIDHCIDMHGLPPICNCECNPTVICEENDTFIIVHNSFDGREGVEWAIEIINK